MQREWRAESWREEIEIVSLSGIETEQLILIDVLATQTNAINNSPCLRVMCIVYRQLYSSLAVGLVRCDIHIMFIEPQNIF